MADTRFGGLVSISSGSEGCFSYQCTHCEAKDSAVNSIQVCLTCSVCLCNNCARSHLHTSQINASTHTELDYCEVHKEELLTDYCKTHQAVVCKMCNVAHTDCVDVDSIENVSKHVTGNGEVDRLLGRLNELNRKLKFYQEYRRKDLDHLTSDKQNSAKQLKRIRFKINEVLDTLERHLQDEIDRAFEKHSDLISSHLSKLQSKINSLEEEIGRLHKAAQTGNDRYLFLTMQTSHPQCIHQFLEEIQRERESSEIKFQPNYKILAGLKKIKNLGKVTSSSKLAASHTDSNIQPSIQTEDQQQSLEFKNTTQVAAKRPSLEYPSSFQSAAERSDQVQHVSVQSGSSPVTRPVRRHPIQSIALQSSPACSEIAISSVLHQSSTERPNNSHPDIAQGSHGERPSCQTTISTHMEPVVHQHNIQIQTFRSNPGSSTVLQTRFSDAAFQLRTTLGNEQPSNSFIHSSSHSESEHSAPVPSSFQCTPSTQMNVQLENICYQLTEDLKDRHIIEVGRYNVREDDDIRCCVTGATFLEDKSLLICDTHNRKVKHIDSELKMMFSIRLPNEPHDITMLNQQEALITIPHSKQLQYLTVRPSVELGRTVGLGRMCWGVTIHRNKLYVSCSDPSEVLVVDQAGCVVQIYSKGESDTQLPHVLNVEVGDNAIVYVADSLRGAVTALHPGGDTLYNYTSDNLAAPHGMLVDNTQHVYVCGSVSENILILTAGGQLYRELVNKRQGLVYPSSMAYRASDKTLIVGCRGDNMIVYRFV